MSFRRSAVVLQRAEARILTQDRAGLTCFDLVEAGLIVVEVVALVDVIPAVSLIAVLGQTVGDDRLTVVNRLCSGEVMNVAAYIVRSVCSAFEVLSTVLIDRVRGRRDPTRALVIDAPSDAPGVVATYRRVLDAQVFGVVPDRPAVDRRDVVAQSAIGDFAG